MEKVDVYNNDRRFIFSNWTVEDFTGKWETEFTTIKSGETVELPMYKAYNFCKHLVDREMNRIGQSNLMGNDDVRKPFEDKTIAEITAGTDSPAMAALKEKIRAEIEGTKTPGEGMDSGNVNVDTKEDGEFADLVEEVKPVKAKKVK